MSNDKVRVYTVWEASNRMGPDDKVTPYIDALAIVKELDMVKLALKNIASVTRTNLETDASYWLEKSVREAIEALNGGTK